MAKIDKKTTVQTSMDATKEKIEAGMEELKKILAAVSAKIEKTDDKTKKKIIAGLAGSAALIAGAIGISRLYSNRKKKK